MNETNDSFEKSPLGNQELLSLVRLRDRLLVDDPFRLLPILRPCRVRVLLVTDGGLDFSLGDFGLRSFVEILRTMPGWYVRFEISVAHMLNVSDDAVMVGQPGIARSIKQFKFDDPDHFAPAMYDQVWLFGIDTFYNRGTSPSGQPYPSDRLGDAELRALSEFMDGGGGLFATGDHGALGVCLSGSVPRARSMRLWGDTTADPLDPGNEVSMSGVRRNDTNRLGPSPGSQFNDQSDDVPQSIAPKMYRRWAGWWSIYYPHPILCGPRGAIRILPDHPHEGQCVVPVDTDKTDTFAGYTIIEYPPSSVGPVRPLPEVIATSTVLAGTTSGGKQPTDSHTFGAIGAYNGHRAAVGRLVTDATWHHYVNINLVGDSSAPAGDPKRLGFLASPAGQAHLEDIKAYYRNIAVWLSPPRLLACMRRRICWGLLWHHRIMEAVMSRPELPLSRAKIGIIYEIGRHARDVLGLYAGQCQSRLLPLDLLTRVIDQDLLARLDPWAPLSDGGPIPPEPDPLPWVDLDPLLDAAIGGAVLALREEFRTPDARNIASDDAIDKAIGRGVNTAVELSLQSFDGTIRSVNQLLRQPGAKGQPAATKPKRPKRRR